MKFQKNIPIKDLNTFKIDIKCKLFCRIESTNDFLYLLNCSEFKENKSLVLGGGSNILFKEDYEGLIISNEIYGKYLIDEDIYTVTIKVGAGEDWHQFVLWFIEKGFSGIENMSLIPGKVGASPIQNIGAYGVEVKDFIENVFAISKYDGKKLVLSNADCQFKYRDSIFKQNLKEKVFITHVSFKLNKHPEHNIEYGDIKDEIKRLGLTISTKNISQAVINIRERKLPNPNKIGNCGSFFKNPTISRKRFEDLKKLFPGIIGYNVSSQRIKIAAAWLIQECGWKGYRNKDVGVHKNQALVLVNYGEGKGEEIAFLAKEIQASVKKKFDISLDREVNII